MTTMDTYHSEEKLWIYRKQDCIGAQPRQPISTSGDAPHLTAQTASVSRGRVAVAAGPAFTFGYAEHAELLAAAGVEVTEFDPITAGTLPGGTDALVVGGGFPELYAAELAANVGLRAEVRDRVAAGMPVIAECAGLLWLGRELDGSPQCGVLPTAATMTGKLTLGYREAVALASSPLAPAGTVLRAHEFHRTVSVPAHGPSPAWRLSDGNEHGWASDSLLASYLHVHWAGVPAAAGRLVAAAADSPNGLDLRFGNVGCGGFAYRWQVRRIHRPRLQVRGELQQQLGHVARRLEPVGTRTVVHLFQPQEFHFEPELGDLKFVAFACSDRDDLLKNRRIVRQRQDGRSIIHDGAT